MAEGRYRLCLSLESCERSSIRGKVLGQNLDRDLAIESSIPRAIDLTLPARTERGLDLTRSESAAGVESHESHHYFFNASVQFRTTVRGEDVTSPPTSSSAGTAGPSAETSQLKVAGEYGLPQASPEKELSGERFRKDFDRDGATKLRVASPEHLAHPTSAKRRKIS